MKRLFAILFLGSMLSVANAADITVNLLPPKGADNVFIAMPFPPEVGEKIHYQGKRYRVLSREWDADGRVLHCKVSVVLTN